jgi:hypothetical protein
VHTNANKSLTNPGQQVYQSDLQMLLFDLTNMHRLTLKIEEDIEFQKALSVKQFLEICPSLRIW